MSPVDLKSALGVAEEVDVAALLRMTLPSLRNQRARGAGPPYQRIGKRVFYPLDKLRKYLAESTVTPSRAPSLVDGNRKRRARPGGAKTLGAADRDETIKGRQCQ